MENGDQSSGSEQALELTICSVRISVNAAIATYR